MADSENTPFLSDNDREDGANDFSDSENEASIANSSANSHFKRSIKILTIVLTVFSGLVVMTAIASIVLIQVASFNGYTYNAREGLRDLGICVS
tara:strand:- start:696 stop:977 length:282 start_codon:yes stop_codon:yes gene_type:complete